MRVTEAGNGLVGGEQGRQVSVVAWSNPDQAAGEDVTVRLDAEVAAPRAALVDPHALLSHALTEELNRSGIPTTAVWADSAEDIVFAVEQAQADVIQIGRAHV